jgi:hypothetical protein
MPIMLLLRIDQIQVSEGYDVLDSATNLIFLRLAEYLRQYLTQVRQELAARLVEKLYADGTGKPSKWWMSFQKRRFMNRSLG